MMQCDSKMLQGMVTGVGELCDSEWTRCVNRSGWVGEWWELSSCSRNGRRSGRNKYYWACVWTLCIQKMMLQR